MSHPKPYLPIKYFIVKQIQTMDQTVINLRGLLRGPLPIHIS